MRICVCIVFYIRPFLASLNRGREAAQSIAWWHLLPSPHVCGVCIAASWAMRMSEWKLYAAEPSHWSWFWSGAHVSVGVVCLVLVVVAGVLTEWPQMHRSYRQLTCKRND